MKELLEFISDFIILIGKDISNNKGKIILITIFVLIGIILFVSPGFILVFFYNENILTNDVDVVKLFSVFIIDSIVFIGLLIIGLVRGVTIPKSYEKDITYEENILRDIITTIVFMGIISTIMILIFIIFKFQYISYTSRVGILTLISVFILLIIKYIWYWIKIFCGFLRGKINYKKAIQENIKVKQINNNLPDDDDEEI